MKRILITFLLYVAQTGITNAQVPSNDSAWIIQTSLSDEFNSAYIDSASKWYKHYGNFISTNPDITLANGAELNFSRNLIMTGSTLKIKADTLSPNITVTDTNKLVYGYSVPIGGGMRGPLTFAYQGGVLVSQSTNYKFGYLEIYAKFPSRKFSLWPAFWIQGSGCGANHYVNEIDIAECSALNTYKGNHMGNNFYVTANHCNYDSIEYSQYGYPPEYSDIVLPVDSLSGGFHKFALSWEPKSFTYLFDDAPTWTVTDPTGQSVPQNGLHVFLNFCVQAGTALLPSNWVGVISDPPPCKVPTKWPQYFEIDYFRYYKLGLDCSSPQAICTPSNYNRMIKKSITVGGGSCTPVYSPSTWNGSYTLRATDYIIIDEGTTINPSGTGYFVALTMACPQ